MGAPPPRCSGSKSWQTGSRWTGQGSMPHYTNARRVQTWMSSHRSEQLPERPLAPSSGPATALAPSFSIGTRGLRFSRCGVAVSKQTVQVSLKATSSPAPAAEALQALHCSALILQRALAGIRHKFHLYCARLAPPQGRVVFHTSFGVAALIPRRLCSGLHCRAMQIVLGQCLRAQAQGGAKGLYGG